jgi:16S rRNA (cytidine1402-2'-O)-methyltransferase
VEFILSNPAGTLYIIATPIGNLEDISFRALSILKQVKYIAAEDTRQSKKLLNHYDITTRLISHHKFNERNNEQKLIKDLHIGHDIALISDAGTPLICDPGSGLVKSCHEAGIHVVPVPGPSALITALSASGLSCDRFVFDGFLPEKKSMRTKLFKDLLYEDRSMVFYETPHRIMATLNDIREIFSEDQIVFVARELTKKYETLYCGAVSKIKELLHENVSQQKGEFVIVIKGSDKKVPPSEKLNQKVMESLLRELPLKKAASLAAEITGESKNNMYKLGLDLQKKAEY